MKKVLHGLLFDKDGTLFDFAQSWGQCMALILGALTEDEGKQNHLGKLVGFDLAQMCFVPNSLFIAGTVAETASVMARHLPNHTEKGIIALIRSFAVQSKMVPVVPLVPLMQVFRSLGLKLGVATNDNYDTARSHLSVSGLLPYLDFVAGADSGFGAKPETGMLLAFANEMALEPSHVAMVGDSHHDLLAGRSAGMMTVGILTGIATENELKDLADVALPDISVLPEWLSQLH
ncbi:MAG: phosphoglycolate phosphatase [Paracoccaceae bacterium]|jgi:phosphoglycolate phosphatase